MEKMRLVGPEIKTLSNMIKRRIDSSKVISEVDKLTGMHGWFIGYLYNHSDRDIFQRDIEEEFSIRRSTATGILQLMEKNGLITREPVKQDARLKKLVLTPKAIAVHEEITGEIEKIESDLIKGLTEEEIETFLSLINKMKKNME
jgi:DNA-binding MarR family transcriptional regulator